MESGAILGIDHRHLDQKFINGGAAIFDFDNDGNLDIYLTGGEESDQLYHNQGAEFEEIAEQAGFGQTANIKTAGVIAGDINNDGYKDLFVTTDKGFNNLLYLNNGDGTFTDISESAGIVDDIWSSSAAFGDYNMDGYLDIYVANYAEFDPDFQIRFDLFLTGGISNFFYINNGNSTFTERASELGVDDAGGGLSVLFSDFDNDNDLDIYVCNDFLNDFGPSKMYENLYPEDAFKDITEDSRTGKEINGMGCAVGDYNNDHWQDLYSTDIFSNWLYRNNQNGTFTNRAGTVGVECNGNLLSENPGGPVSWGASFFDYNNDSYLDLFVATGNMVPDSYFGEQYQLNHLFQGSSSKLFSDVSVEEGITHLSRTRAVVTGDLDNDGDLDIVLAASDSNVTSTKRSLVYRNSTSGVNWLQVKLQGVANNYDGYGSKVKVYWGDNARMQEIDGGSGYQSHSSTNAHFGLDQVMMVDSIEVLWLGGSIQTVYNVDANQLITITEECEIVEEIQITVCEEEGYLVDGILRTVSGVYEEVVENVDACNLRKIIELTAEDCVVASLLDTSDLRVFPNPAEGEIYVEGSNINEGLAEYSIFDLVGHEVKKGDISERNRTILINELQKGIYVLVVSGRSIKFQKR